MANGLTDRSPKTREKAGSSTPGNPQLDASPLLKVAGRENGLLRLALVILVSLALGIAVVSWHQAPNWTWRQETLPIGLVIMVVLFGLYVLSKTREMAELRGLVYGLEHRSADTPDVGQIEKLFDMVRRSQQGYRDLIDTFEDILFSISTEGKILAANRSFADLLGLSFPDLVGRPLDKFLDLGDGTGRSLAEKALPSFLQKRQWSGVLRIRLLHNGSTRFFQCTLHALVRDGEDLGICVLARDITTDRENELRFTELFETLQEGVYLAASDGKFENVNPALARMLGYANRDEMIGRCLRDFLLDPAHWAAVEAELHASGAIQNREIILRGPQETPIICLHAAAVIRDTGGRVRRHQGTLINITERREMEKKLYREQEFARRLVQSFPDLVVATDCQGRYTYVSPRITELLGYTAAEIIGRHLGERMDPHDRTEVRELFQGLVSGQRVDGTIEYFTAHKNGEMRLFRATASPLLDAAGHIEGVIASARDITDAKRMEQQLIQTERLAAMGQMIAGVAHELNNPLTAILGVTELMRDATTEEKSRGQLDLAHRQAGRAAQIVQNLLSFARPPQPQKVCLQMSELIERSLQLHEHSLRTNRITVDFVPKAELPPVLGDASQLTQVFLNLITNAEQAIREIREFGTLRIRVNALGDNVVATFYDDGVGIRRDLLTKVFDPFFTTKRPGRGTGLGLSICLAILREHNGRIQAQSPSDGGAVITVSVPIARGNELFLANASPSSKAEPPMPPSPMARLAGRKVLVVDDEEGIRDLVRDGLTARKMLVDVAASAEEALLLLETHPYYAVLCDLNLGNAPGSILSGRDLREKIMNSPSHSPNHSVNGRKPFFLFMTGELVGSVETEDLARAGAPMLQKPFRVSEVAAILSSALAGAPSSAQ